MILSGWWGQTCLYAQPYPGWWSLMDLGMSPGHERGPLIYLNRLSSSAQAQICYIYILCLFKKWGVNYTFTFTGIIINDPPMHLWEPIRNSQYDRWCQLAPGLSFFLGQGSTNGSTQMAHFENLKPDKTWEAYNFDPYPVTSRWQWHCSCALVLRTTTSLVFCHRFAGK